MPKKRKSLMGAAMEQEVAERLMQLGFKIQVGGEIAGYEPDIVATAPDGRTVVLEIKSWAPDQHHVERAKAQVQLYKRALGADVGIVVLPSFEH